MIDIKFNYNNALSFVSKEIIQSYQQKIDSSFEKLYNKNGKGNDFLGWMDLPDTISNELIEEIETLAKKIRSQAQVYVVVGIGGSYLGSRAVIEALSHHFVQLKNLNRCFYSLRLVHHLIVNLPGESGCLYRVLFRSPRHFLTLARFPAKKGSVASPLSFVAA